MSDRPSLLINQAAAHAGVSRRCMYYWIKEAKVETFKTLNGSTRVWVDSIPERERRAAPDAREVDRREYDNLRVARGHQWPRLTEKER